MNGTSDSRAAARRVLGTSTLLARLAAAGIAGGRTDDALIAEQTAHSPAVVLLTLNPRHFEPPPPGVVVVEPR